MSEKKLTYKALYMKQYLAESPKIECACGIKFKACARAAHNRSKRHHAFLAGIDHCLRKKIDVLDQQIADIRDTLLDQYDSGSED